MPADLIQQKAANLIKHHNPCVIPVTGGRSNSAVEGLPAAQKAANAEDIVLATL